MRLAAPTLPHFASLALCALVGLLASACKVDGARRGPVHVDGQAAEDATRDSIVWLDPKDASELLGTDAAGKYVDFSKLPTRQLALALSGVKDLAGMRVTRTRVEPASVTEAVLRSPGMIHVDLSGSSGVDAACLDAVCGLPDLRHLKLFDVTSLLDRHLLKLARSGCLETLDVGLSRWMESVTEEGVVSQSVAFLSVARSTPLRWLRCSGRDLVDMRGAEALAKRNYLEVFICGHSNRPTVPTDVVAKLLRCPLRLLDVGERNAASDWKPVDARDRESELRDALISCATLLSVSLNYRLQDADALCTGFYRYQRPISALSLRGSNGLTDAGLEVLGKLKHLSALDVVDCELITTKGLSQVAACRSLRHLAFGSLQNSSALINKEVFSVIGANEWITQVSVAASHPDSDLAGLTALSRVNALELISPRRPLPKQWASHVAQMAALKSLRIVGASELLPHDLDRVLSNNGILTIALISCSGEALEEPQEAGSPLQNRVVVRHE